MSYLYAPVGRAALYSPLGVTPPVRIPRPEFGPGMMQRFRDVPLPQGELYKIGPTLLFKPGGSSVTVSRQWFESPAGLATQRWISGSAEARGGLTYWSYMLKCYQDRPLFKADCAKTYKGWGFTGLAGAPLRALEGKIPIYRAKHPKTGEMWGIYTRWEQGKIIITWQRIPVDPWYLKLLAGLFEIIVDVIKTIQGLIDFLAKAACVLMKPAMMALAAYVGGPAMVMGPPPAMPEGMSDEEYNHIKKGWAQIEQARVKKSDLRKLYETGANSVATSIANSVSKVFCGTPTVVPPPTTTNWALIGGLGLIGAALYLRSR